MKWYNTLPPRDRLIMRWHKFFKCPMAVYWAEENRFHYNGVDWIGGENMHVWPEDAFTPEWAECLTPPKSILEKE